MDQNHQWNPAVRRHSACNSRGPRQSEPALRRNRIRPVRHLQPRPELGTHEERPPHRSRVRPPDSSPRARSHPRHARPFHLDHGQHHRARRDGGQRKRHHFRPAFVHAEAQRRMENGQLPGLPRNRPVPRRQSASGSRPRLLLQNRRPGPRDRERQGRQRCSPVERPRRSRNSQPPRVGHALRRPHPSGRGQTAAAAVAVDAAALVEQAEVAAVVVERQARQPALHPHSQPRRAAVAGPASRQPKIRKPPAVRRAAAGAAAALEAIAEPW